MKDRKEIDNALSNKELYLFSLIMSVLIIAFYYITSLAIGLKKEDNIPSFLLVVFAMGVLLSFFIHELIHYVSFLYFIKWKNRDALKIGFSLKYFAPYCHCSAIISINQYRYSVIAPFIVLSFISFFIGILIQSQMILIYSLILTLGCTGDFFILLKLRKYSKDALIKDHATKPGCIVYVENKN